MTQKERRIFLIKQLLKEQPRYHGRAIPRDLTIPEDEVEQKNLLRALMNIRRPKPISDDFLTVQDEYLREEIAAKGITDLAELFPVSEGIYLWQGDITTLRCGAIVNAANSDLTGCYAPGHLCIDNCIHTSAGVQLRLECARLVAEQGHQEETGRAKITPAYNLPSQYVLHTVGPLIRGEVTGEDEALLASCYRSCLELAEQNGVTSIAFCCISTGEFHFPNDRAAEIAVQTVKQYRAQTGSAMEVIFNVFKDVDHELYRNVLGECWPRI